MKKLTLLFTVFFAAFYIKAQNVAINTDGSTADPSAMLDVKSSDKGILIPRVSLQQVNSILPLTSTPPAGLMVYNINHNMLDLLGRGIGRGFYYWNGASWLKVMTPTEVSDSVSLRWSLYGNSSTSPTIHFIGTTDDADLVFKRNKIKSGWIGSLNTSFGNYSLSSMNNNAYGGNSAFGINSLKSNTSGSVNTGVGASALLSNTSGSYNTAVGLSALEKNTTGQRNTGIGGYSLMYNTGSDNTAVGYYALYSNNNGTRNTAIGYFAGVAPNLTNATAIGANASANLSNTLVLGGTGDDAVKVGIGTPVPQTDLEIKQSAGSNSGIKLINGSAIGYHWRMAVNSSGNLEFYRNATLKAYFNSNGAHVVVSDRHMKKDISSVENVLPKVMMLEAKTYHYTDDSENDALTYGLIAQDVEKVFPEFVHTKCETGMKAVAYENFGVIAIQAIKEQQSLIEEQNEKIQELIKEVNQLKTKIK